MPFKADFLPYGLGQLLNCSLVPDEHGFDSLEVLAHCRKLLASLSQLSDELRSSLNQQRHSRC